MSKRFFNEIFKKWMIFCSILAFRFEYTVYRYRILVIFYLTIIALQGKIFRDFFKSNSLSYRKKNRENIYQEGETKRPGSYWQRYTVFRFFTKFKKKTLKN